MVVSYTYEAKELGLQSVQLCTKHRQKGATLSPYHQCRKLKEVVPLKAKGLMYSNLLTTAFTLRSWTLSWHLKTIQVQASFLTHHFTDVKHR